MIKKQNISGMPGNSGSIPEFRFKPPEKRKRGGVLAGFWQEF